MPNSPAQPPSTLPAVTLVRPSEGPVHVSAGASVKASSTSKRVELVDLEMNVVLIITNKYRSLMIIIKGLNQL